MFCDDEKVAPVLLHKDPLATEETGDANIPGIKNRDQTTEDEIEMTTIVDLPAHHLAAEGQATAIVIA